MKPVIGAYWTWTFRGDRKVEMRTRWLASGRMRKMVPSAGDKISWGPDGGGGGADRKK